MNERELKLRKRRLLQAKRLLHARADVNSFVEYCFTDESGRDIAQQEFHAVWQDHVDTNTYAGILAPRGHGKSQQLVIFRAIWELGHNPNLRCKIISNNLPNAKKRLKAIRAHIAGNKRVAAVFPNLKPSPTEEDWSQGAITVQRTTTAIEPSIEAKAILSAGTGGRADLEFYDDVCDRENSIDKPGDRTKVKSAFWEDWMNLLEPDGRCIYVATPWHKDDLTHELRKNGEWCWVVNAIDSKFTPLWPDKWPRERLIKKCNNTPTIAFNRAYRLIAYSDEMRVFNQRSVEDCKDHNLTPKMALELTKDWPKYTGVDLASGKKSKESKYSAVVTVAVDPKSKARVVIDLQRGQWRWGMLLAVLKRVHEKYHPLTMFVENNAVQELVVQALRSHNQGALPVKGIQTGKEKMDEEIGIPAMSLDFDHHMWVLPYGLRHPEEQCPCNLCMFVTECVDFPDGATSDILMAAWFATKHLERTVFDMAHLTAYTSEALRHLDEISVTSAYSVKSPHHVAGAPYEDGW